MLRKLVHFKASAPASAGAAGAQLVCQGSRVEGFHLPTLQSSAKVVAGTLSLAGTSRFVADDICGQRLLWKKNLVGRGLGNSNRPSLDVPSMFFVGGEGTESYHLTETCEFTSCAGPSYSCRFFSGGMLVREKAHGANI